MTGRPILRSASLCIAVVLGQDVLSAALSAYTGVAYADFIPLELFIYVAIGFYLARRLAMASAISIVVTTALIDATIGWGLSAVIGPGRVLAPLADIALTSFLAFVVFIASGGVGLFLGILISRSRGKK